MTESGTRTGCVDGGIGAGVGVGVGVGVGNYADADGSGGQRMRRVTCRKA
ncbi:hypothetical protein [Streptomyces sp. NPDC017520]